MTIDFKKVRENRRIMEGLAGSVKQNSTALLAMGNAVRLMHDNLGVYEPDTLIHYQTGGQWSLHQMIGYYLHQMNPVDLYITSWSCTEEPVKFLTNLKLKGFIRSAYGILSDRTIERNPKAYDAAQGLFDKLRLTKLHAKVAVLINEKQSVTIVGSSNLTNNPRIECGVVDTHYNVAQFHKKWIAEKIEK